MPLSTTAKNQALDAITADRISLHNGDPGGSGTSNEITGGGYARQSATFNAASSGQRTLASDVNFSATPAQSITHFGVWLNSGTVFKGSGALSGDNTANASGEYTVKGGTTMMSLSDS